MRRLIFVYSFGLVVTLLALQGCSLNNLADTPNQDPLVYNLQEIQSSESIIVFVPGALSPITIFDPAKEWKDEGYALVYYRLPGLDGTNLDSKLIIEDAAIRIAAFVNQFPQKFVGLVGYSTGGAVVIEASQYTNTPNLKVAALSPSPRKAGGLSTLLRSSTDVFQAAFRIGSLDKRKVWMEYYRTLLFGREGLDNPTLNEEMNRIISKEKDNIIFPTVKMYESHSKDLESWNPSLVPLDSENIAFFIGKEDPVFSSEQTYELAELTGVSRIFEYDEGGHLLFLTHPEVFDDILRFLQE